jgi:hypothetical protein
MHSEFVQRKRQNPMTKYNNFDSLQALKEFEMELEDIRTRTNTHDEATMHPPTPATSDAASPRS